MKLPAAIIASLALLLGMAHPAHAQQAKVHRVGVLLFAEPLAPEGPAMRAIVQGLRDLGYAKGKNIEIVARSAENRGERLPALAAELLAQKPDVLLAGSTPGALAVKRATRTVPIVFAGVLDPVGSGLVPSLAQPGGNVTGVTAGIGGEGFTAKCLQLLKETAPGLSRVAALVNPGYALTPQFRKEFHEIERSMNLKLDLHDASNAAELERALAAIAASPAQGIFVAPDPFLTGSSARIAQFAVDRKLASLHYSERYAEAGGLVSYGGSLDESYRRAAAYVDRVLRGAQPGQLPVEQPTRFQLVVNLATAKALGVQVPRTVLSRADRTIR